MPAWVAQSRAYLERWIDEEGVDPAQITRIIDGLAASAGREPSQLAGPQRPEVLIPGLTATPWWDRDLFPWVRELEGAATLGRSSRRSGGWRPPRPSAIPTPPTLPSAVSGTRTTFTCSASPIRST